MSGTDLVLPLEDVNALVERHRGEKWVNLDPKKRAFAIEFAACLDPVSAGDKVGLAPANARRYLQDPYVLALVSDLQAEHHQFNIITEAFIRAQLLDVLPKMKGDEPVAIVDGDGCEHMVRKFHPAGTRAIIAELGKSLQREHGVKHIHKGEIEHNHNANVSIHDVANLYAHIAENNQRTIEGEIVSDE